MTARFAASPYMRNKSTHCPDCGRPAEVIDRFVLDSTAGPIEHVKIRCSSGPESTVPLA